MTGVIEVNETARAFARGKAEGDAVIARLREALDSIEELNKFPPDEHGHRWWRSDLIGQEIILARMHTASDAPPVDAAAVIARLREALAELLQVQDGVPMMGQEASRRAEAARAALQVQP